MGYTLWGLSCWKDLMKATLRGRPNRGDPAGEILLERPCWGAQWSPAGKALKGSSSGGGPVKEALWRGTCEGIFARDTLWGGPCGGSPVGETQQGGPCGVGPVGENLLEGPYEGAPVGETLWRRIRRSL